MSQNRLASALASDPVDRVLDALRAFGLEPVPSGDQWQCRCPAHDDRDPSLSIGRGDNGDCVLNCFAGCPPKAVVERIGLKLSDLFANDQSHEGNGKHKRRPGPAVNWSVVHDACRTAFDGMRDELVEVLGVPGSALDDVGYGWSESDGAFTSPERDAWGRVLGIGRRYRDGRKQQMSGSTRGLTIPASFPSPGGPVLVVEGPSCTAAAVAAGLCAVGRPSNTGGAGHLADLLRPLPPGREILVVGENDKGAKGWPGKDGAIQIAEKLAKALGRPVRWSLPPDGMKDVRAWLVSRVGENGTAPTWAGAGGELVGKLLAAARPESTMPRGWAWDLIDSATFAAGDFRPTWVVKRLVVAREPLTIAGSEKTLKTTIAADLAVCLGTQTPFLGRFDVYVKQRVAVLSGESGRHALQSAFLRICQARGVDPVTADVLWGFTLPAFTDPAEMDELGRRVAEHGIGMVIADPAYLCVLRGGNPDDARNFFAMGQHLSRFSEAVIRGGATPVIVHHANRQLKVGDVMQLADLSYSGFSHHAAQWLLLSREVEYQGDGRHRLWLNAGGREGQGGLWSLAIDEGILGDDFFGRRWDVAVEPAGQHRERAEQEREEAKDRKAQEKVEADAAELHKAWLNFPERSNTPTKAREFMGWGAARVGPALRLLVERRRLMAGKVKVPCGPGTREVEGFVAVSGGPESDG